MAELKKVLNALKNCTAQQKCRNCNWSECESDHKTVEIPLTLAKDAMKLLREQKKRIEELESEKTMGRIPGHDGKMVNGKMIIITTMDELPKGCYECPLCHETYCMAMKVGDDGWPYQSAQEIRPYNCPLKEVPEPPKEEV